MKKYLLISGRGGGRRGQPSVFLLQRLIEESGVDVVKRADLIAGTSTWGVISCGLASGLSPKEIVNFFHDLIPRVFKKDLIRTIFGLDGWLKAKYDIAELNNVLLEKFNGIFLEDLNKKVLLTSFNLSTNKTKFWNNFKGQDGQASVALLTRYTSQAPTYFQILDKEADGGISVVDPAFAGATEIKKRFNAKPENIFVLSNRRIGYN